MRIVIFLTVLIFTFQGAIAYESSFPFPFEFGHSSDIYLDVKKPAKKDVQAKQDAIERLKEMGIKRSPDDFVKYIKKDNYNAIKLLIEAGFDINAPISADYPIYYSAKYNKTRITRLLLEKGANPNKDFTSPVRFAILKKNFESVRDLVEFGANVNYFDDFTSESLLYTALKKRQYDIAAFLIEKGAKMDGKSYKFIKNKNLGGRLGVSVD